jgi:hypothetical protein
MPTSEAYKRMANRCAELAIVSSAPSIAAALLALALDYMALANKLDQFPKEEQRQEIQEENGFGD